MSQTPADLLRQISSFNAGKQGEGEGAAAIRRPAESKSAGLIQVISSVEARPQVPEHRLQLKADGAGGARRVLLTVELPKVSSVSECQLRISEVGVERFNEQGSLSECWTSYQTNVWACVCVSCRMTSCWRWRASTICAWISQQPSTRTRRPLSLTGRNGHSP